MSSKGARLAPGTGVGDAGAGMAGAQTVFEWTDDWGEVPLHDDARSIPARYRARARERRDAVKDESTLLVAPDAGAVDRCEPCAGRAASARPASFAAQ